MAADTFWTEEEQAYQDAAIGLPVPVAAQPDNLYRPEPDDVVRLFEALDAADPAEVNGMIDAVEMSMVVATHLNPELQLVDLVPSHQFPRGEYFRQLEIPAGVLVTSRQHLTEHTCFVTAGAITIWSLETGIQHITAPYMFRSYPGSRRIGLAHEDTVWTTVHDNPDGTQDIATLESRLYAPYIKPEDRPETQQVLAQIAGRPALQEGE